MLPPQLILLIQGVTGNICVLHSYIIQTTLVLYHLLGPYLLCDKMPVTFCIDVLAAIGQRVVVWH